MLLFVRKVPHAFESLLSDGVNGLRPDGPNETNLTFLSLQERCMGSATSRSRAQHSLAANLSMEEQQVQHRTRSNQEVDR